MSHRVLHRVLLKLTGESLCAPGGFGHDADALRSIAAEVASAAAHAQVAVVIGGGNIIRGGTLAESGLIERATADHMGMLGTIINGLALREALEHVGQPADCVAALEIPGVVRRFERRAALASLEAGRVVICAGGVGHPFFTTDTTAALRAAELGCDAVLKATKVDGVYSADPKKDASATRFDTLTFAEALERRLGVMDLTALAMCQSQGIGLVVFDFAASGNTARVVRGEPIGTLVTP
ncbi:MAG: UMP kinase [Planctomycetota bacterium]